MEFVLSLIENNLPYLQWPEMAGLLVWAAAFAGLVLLLWRLRAYQRVWQSRDWLSFIALTFLALLTSLFIGFRIPLGESVSIPGMMVTQTGMIWMVLAAIPWVLAAGAMGPLASFLLGLLSGFLLAVFETHNPYTALEFGLAGLAMGYFLNQRFRTPFYRLLRRPLAAGAIIALVYPGIYLPGILLWRDSALAQSLDYGFATLLASWQAFAGSVLIAGLAAEAVYWRVPRMRPGVENLIPSPAERSLETRTFLLMGSVVGLAVVVLAVLGWNVAYDSAEALVRERMESTARLAAENVPYALEIGQNLIQTAAANPDLRVEDTQELAGALADMLVESPYFNHFLLADNEGAVLAAAPASDEARTLLTPQEEAGVALAREGVPFQYYAYDPLVGPPVSQVTFLVPLPSEGRVLVGRSSLAQNPFTAPLINSLNNLQDIGGEGLLLDEKGTILYHPEAERINTPYPGTLGENTAFFEDTAPDGSRRLVYAQSAVGRPWVVVLAVGLQKIQEQALKIALPLIGALLVLSAVLMVLLRVTLRFVTGSLRNLSQEASLIAEDRRKLALPLRVEGVDEVGTLRQAFERMRRSLKARLDEQEQLLLVSNGVAASLEMEMAAAPILAAALTSGAASARLVLKPGVLPRSSPQVITAFERLNAGASPGQYAYLDDPILEMARERTPVILTNPLSERRLSFANREKIPGSLIAVALTKDTEFYGVLWLGYERSHTFPDEERRFLSTLAAQAALATTNIHLFETAEIGRQRLAAILASTPDPVLVTDSESRLLLSNPAAWQVFGPDLSQGQGSPIQDLVWHPALVEILKASQADSLSQEVTLSDGKVYIAKATTVMADGIPVGRIGVLRDVTRMKTLDTLKSEFVSTVSHDLRSPLTLMRGYATMLDLVGDLNEDQTGYVRKILVGVESMTRLVNNLLDLGRIESGIGLTLQLVPVVDVFDRVIESLRLAAEQKKITMSFRYPGGSMPLVQADQALLEQALFNLVENAVKYTPLGGRVEVRLRLDEELRKVVFEVLDNGPGIAPPDQPRIFEKFFRVQDRRFPNQKGSGLGLAIVKSIVEKHGGSLDVESEMGKGSRFIMRIPLKQPESVLQG